ncbi:glycosyltransferase family 2 protein [Acuticoccus sediminis]|uniref:glycosyltransferase family 2 protein n=1 Tax=Acuticoccus sediminis TaxID=2184697 RepID=UPI001391DB06|nr:glycosyltransferase [Acuticoccus sediminis]
MTSQPAASAPPTVSIGLAVYNGAEYLEEAIDSILSQTYPDFELIISDNASTDGTREICERAQARDPRVRYDRLPKNLGAAPNYNRIVAMARGRYFKWAAHDDRCHPDFLARCMDALRDDSVVLAYTKTSVIDAQGRELRTYSDGLTLDGATPAIRFAQYLRGNVLGVRGMCNPIFGVIRTDALRKTRLIQDFIASDRTLLGHLALMGRFVEVDTVAFDRRVHLGTSTMASAAFKDRAKWFNPQSVTSRSRRRNNYLRLSLTHIADYWQAMGELLPNRSDRIACRAGLVANLARRPKWIWRDLKYSFGGAPNAAQILDQLKARDAT